MRLFVSASTPSSDRLLAAALPELQRRYPALRCVGPCGPQSLALGVDPRPGPSDVVGLGPFLRALPDGLRALRRLQRSALGCDAALLVDQPELHGPLAHRLVRRIPTVRLVPPQAWAWRPWRAGHRGLREAAAVLCLWPFETRWFRERGISATTVGFPRASLGPPSDPDALAVLPGSRARARARHRRPLQEALRAHPGRRTHWAGGGGEAGPSGRNTLARCGAALVASGTATLEAALAARPTVAFYGLPRWEQAVARRLLRIPFVSLPNLLLGCRPEDPLVDEVIPLRADAVARRIDALFSRQARERAEAGARALDQLLPRDFAQRVAAALGPVLAP